MSNSTMKAFAPALLRLALAGVYMWFGVSQLTDPSGWAGVVPDWATNLSGLEASLIAQLNGAFEVVMSLLLVLGIAVRFVAAILAIHLFVIASGFGLSPTGVRDFGLAFATLSLALSGQDRFCLWQPEKE